MRFVLMGIVICLTGCTSLMCPPEKDQPVVVKYKYILNQVPDELLTIPDETPDIDTAVATDKDAALWMTDKERRSRELEKRLTAIKQYQDKKLKSLNLPEADIIK